MDVKIKTENEKFKFRVSGVIVKDNKVLGVDICDNGFFCCPGGHVHLGEDTITAIGREMSEETGIDCKRESPLLFLYNSPHSSFHKRRQPATVRHSAVPIQD